MTDYTIRNLKEVEDSAPKFGMEGFETRFAREALELEHSGVTYLRLDSGVRSPFGHKHERQEELYLVIGGSGRIKLDDDVVDLRPWDAVRIPTERMRCLEAGPDGLELVLFGAPNTGPGDAQLAPGWWVD